MAKPSYHLIATTILFIAILILNKPEDITGIFTTLFHLGIFGVLVDTDHIYSLDWIKNFIRHKKVIMPKGWKNKFHTFKAAALVTIVSLLIGSYLPMLAYGIHMIIDGANAAYDDSWENEGSYLPWGIHKFYPRWKPSYCYKELEN